MTRRIRSIKPSFTDSESVGRLSREARLLFILLWTLVDDEGRCRGAPQYLSSVLYPYDADAKSLIAGWLCELAREGCVQCYSVGGNQYVQVMKWKDHQLINRPSASKFPQPPVASREFSEASVNPHGGLSEAAGKLRADMDMDKDSTQTTSESAPRSGVADNQKDNQQEDGAKAQPIDPASSSVPPKGGAAASIWGAPVHYLTAHGVPEARARSQIGKWLKSRDPQTVIDAITTAQLNAAVDPVAFITKVLLAGGSNGKIQGQYGRGGQSKHDAMAELKRFQRELEERERGGRDGLGEIIDI